MHLHKQNIFKKGYKTNLRVNKVLQWIQQPQLETQGKPLLLALSVTMDDGVTGLL